MDLELINDINNDEIIDKGGEEEEIEELDIRACKFSTYGGDFLIRQLTSMIEEDEIETPKIQRHYVWTNKIASRFIESILLDLPLPSIFLAKNESGKFVIVDGLQRLTTLYKYIVDETVNGKTFKLSTSKDIRSEWRGKAFRELTVEDQRRLKNKLLHAIIVEQKEPTNFDGLFLIFERINTGGLQLNQQEIRNAIFQYPINSLIDELNRDKVWRKMFGMDEPHARMRDNEMILRFLALKNLSIIDYKNETMKMVSTLNAFMANNRKASDDRLDYYRKDFLKTISTVNQLYGKNIFRTNINTHQVSQKFYATVYDAIMLSTAFAIEKNINFASFTDTNDRIVNLFNDNEFKQACNAHTTDTSSIKKRIEIACRELYDLKYEK